jgi:transposase
MWKLYQQQVKDIDKRVERLLKDLNEGRPKIEDQTKEKPIRHHKPEIEELQQKMVTLYGVNVSSVSGLTNYSLLKLVGETGNTLEQFPTAKHFISWCRLSPGHNKSGKSNKRVKTKGKSKAGQIFRDAAQSLVQSKHIAIGAFMRKIRSRKGPGIAVKAGARKIAMAYYNMITKGQQYVEQGVKQYEAKLKEREVKLLHLLANKHNLKILAVQ